jgi:hypothetical protein
LLKAFTLAASTGSQNARSCTIVHQAGQLLHAVAGLHLFRALAASFLMVLLLGSRCALRNADDSCSLDTCTWGSRWNAPIGSCACLRGALLS